MGLKLRFFLFSLLIASNLATVAQVSFDSREELEKAANEFFESKQYDKAKPLFSQLLSLNALEPNYNYRFGVCILFTEADPLKPLPYIEGGASTDGVNSEAYYFLGKAYQFNYRFDDAIGFFEKAKKSGFSAEGVNLERSIEECRNGKLLVGDIEFQPAQNKEVIEAEFYRPYDFRKLKGKVIPMPPSFKTKYDQKNLTGTVVYTPSNSQTLFFASYGEDGVNGKDLYKVNRLPGGEWALPQRLPDVINTKYDEDFAFYDAEESTLYFASKGHYSMGGYDVFRSVYTSEDDSWSAPINLQYPINSPFDDFLYVSDPDGKMAFFTSGRDSKLGKLRVFKTLLHDPSQVEYSIVEGSYEDKTDSLFNYMMATVLDPKTNEIVGKYRSNKETGKYLLILPPQNDYKFDVGPNESTGFEFEFDVPKHEVTKPLQQSLRYDSNDADGTVTLTNYFTASGKGDSVALASNRSKEEVEQAMVALPNRDEILAAREKAKEQEENEKKARLAELAAQEEAKLMAELAKNDSLEAVKKAARETEAMRLQAEAAKRDSITKAEIALKEKLAREKAVVDSLAEVELALATEREKFVADSLVKVAEENLLAERQKAVADSLALIAEAEKKEVELARQRAVNDSIAAAEFAALEAQRLAEAEKAKQDSIAAVELAKAEEKEASQEDLLKEMQEKEAEILANQSVESQPEDAPVEKQALAEASSDSTETEELISEADLFLQTLADLETQNEAQAEAVRKENEQLAEERRKQAEELAEKAEVASEGTNDSTEVKPDMAAVDSVLVQEVAATEEVEIQPAALKSDANPDEYLSALAEMEAEMAKAESENNKSYELKELDPVPTESNENLDPKLQQMLDADRKALEEHQRMAAEKEKALQEQLARDKELVSNVAEESDVDEIAAIEAEMLKGLEEKKGSKLDLGSVEETTDTSIKPVETEVLEEVAEAEEKLNQVVEETENVMEEVTTIETPEDDGLIAEADAAMNELLNEAEEVTEPFYEEKEEIQQVAEEEVTVADETVEEIQEVAVESEEVTEEATEEVEETVVEAVEETEQELIAEADQAVNELLEVEEEVTAPTEEPITEQLEKETEAVEEVAAVTKEIVEEVEESVETVEEFITEEVVTTESAEVEPQPAKEEPAPAEMAVSESGQTIPFLEPAMRDYSNRPKPNFKSIENSSMRRMIKRMRAEDIGRLAVLKNMKNQWVDEGKTQESLTAIKENRRNQEVLANLVELVDREEKIREPFDKNDTRTREGVHYQLGFKIATANVSETILEAMTPEQEMTFAMPEFGVTTDYFSNLADARAEMRYYRQRGFDNVEVVAYLNGGKILLSDAENIPFVD